MHRRMWGALAGVLMYVGAAQAGRLGVPADQNFDFCIATCEGHGACFDETYHYRLLNVGGRVIIVSQAVCNGIDQTTGARYHMVNQVNVNASIDGTLQINKLVLVGDRGDTLVLRQQIRQSGGNPPTITTQVECSNPQSVWFQ